MLQPKVSAPYMLQPMEGVQFVLRGRNGSRAGELSELEATLTARAFPHPRRIVAACRDDGEMIASLLSDLRALTHAGVADELVLVAPPARLTQTGEMVQQVLDNYPELDISLVGGDSPREALTPGALLLAQLPEAYADTAVLALARPSDSTSRATLDLDPTKQAAELAFWREILHRWVDWYGGSPLGNLPPPNEEERETRYDPPTNAAVTFSRCYQEMKYLTDLALHPHAFRGLRVLDVGCGPAPSLLAFHGCEPHGVDPLIDGYREVGFPIDLWSRMGYNYHCAPAEQLPFDDNSIDAVVSVNAIDHIDDFAAGAAEIRRVLRPGGIFRMHVHYHPATETEPLVLDDDVFLAHYAWVEGLRRIGDADTKDSGYTRALPGERYVLWGNT